MDLEGSRSQNDDDDWNTDEELELFGTESPGPTYSDSSQASCVVESTAAGGGAKCDKLIHFMKMGFSREAVTKAIEQNGEENEEDILDTLLTLGAIMEDSMPYASNKPCSSKESDIPTDIYDENNYLGSQENTCTFDKDETLATLVNMGYPFDEALISIDTCGPESHICELTDFICAAQLEKELDSILQDPPTNDHDVCVPRHKKPRVNCCPSDSMNSIKWGSRNCRDMTGFSLPNELHPVVARKLPREVAGQPYFYFANVALAPKGVWSKLSRLLFNIEAEFVDSKFFCAASRKRGYIHNLPIRNRSPLLPLQPLTIQEALPTTKKWWPSWDKRTNLNCLLTSIGAATVTDRIRKELEMCGAEPPRNVQEDVLQECRRWNLVWVGKNKVAPLEPDEYERLMGFPHDHTRGGGITRTERYRALGNAFQVDTVAYHLSVLKDHFPSGINVLSLFSGIGGAEVALHRAGIRLKNVVSVEIAEVNRNIIHGWWEQTSQRGNLIEVEDVRQVSSNQLRQWITDFGGFDLIIGGSPCNNLSGSNRVSRDGLEGEHSSLFYEYFRIVETLMDLQRNRPL